MRPKKDEVMDVKVQGLPLHEGKNSSCGGSKEISKRA
jgi:hypothetical protein